MVWNWNVAAAHPKLRPDIVNVIRSSLKLTNTTHNAVFLEINYVINYVFNANDLVMKIKPNGKLNDS